MYKNDMHKCAQMEEKMLKTYNKMRKYNVPSTLYAWR